MFNQRKNKSFNYKPRFQDSEEQKSKDDFETKWQQAKSNTNRKGSIFSSFPFLIVALVSLFVLIYILNSYIK